MLTLLLTGQYRHSTALSEATPEGGQAPNQEYMGNKSSDNICIKRESLDLHSDYLSDRGESTNMAARAEWDTQGNDPLFKEFRMLMISLVFS